MKRPLLSILTIFALLITMGITKAQTPYGGTAWEIPGTIEAEDFDDGGEGVAYHDVEETNYGGAYRTDVGVDINSGGTVGWFKDGEWLLYTVNIQEGTYDITAWAGSDFDYYHGLAIYVNDELITLIDIPYSGSWDAVENKVTGIDLAGGDGQHLKLMNVGDDYDFDKIVFVNTSGGSTTSGDPSGIINIDFGSDDVSLQSGDGWNNMTHERLQDTIPNPLDLVDSNGNATGISIYTYDRPNNVNTNGTQTPDASLELPATASSDSYFGHSEPWSGNQEPTFGFIFQGLDPNTAYSFSIFGSRDATDNREGMYTAIGQNSGYVTMNAASNTSDFPTIEDIYPDNDGIIVLNAEKGSNNTNEYGFFYLGAVRITYDASTAFKELDNSSIKAYPMPFTNELSLTGLPSKSIVSVFSISGAKIIEVNNTNSDKLQLNTSSLKAGIYIVRVASGTSSVKSIKVVKK